MDDTTFEAHLEAHLAECASIRQKCLTTLKKSEKATERCLPKLRKSEKTTEECRTALRDSEETTKELHATLRESEQTTKDCLEILKNLDELTGNIKDRRFETMGKFVEKCQNFDYLVSSRVEVGDGRKQVNPSQNTFKCERAVQQSRLLSLPPEIRNMIWKLCLFHQEDLITKLGDKKMKLEKKYGCFTMTIDSSSVEARPKLVQAYETSIAKRTRRCVGANSLRNLALMQTCQDVYRETAPILWSQRFYFHSILHLQAFLFSNARLDLVRDIFVWHLDRQSAVNYMPAVSAILADKVTGLERLNVDMGCMDKGGGGFLFWQRAHTPTVIREAGVRLGFDVYSCMYPWVTKVVRDQGIEKLMAILQIPRDERDYPLKSGELSSVGQLRIHTCFQHGGKLDKTGREIADTATAGEILRLVNLYDK